MTLRLRSSLLLSLVVAAIASAGCKKKPPVADADASPPNLTAASAAPVPKEAEKPACPPIDPKKVAPYECPATVVKTPVPSIEDPDENMARFYDRMAELARGTAKTRVRIGVYGDSNLTSDFLTSHLRRTLQGRYGDAGHGFVALSKPWGSYHHDDVVHLGFWPMFKLYAPTTHLAPDKQYGFANMAAESKQSSAAAWVATAKDPKAPVGKNVSSFEIYFLKQNYGGTFLVLLDGKEMKRVSTKSESGGWEAGFETIETTDGPHELRVVVTGDGLVRFFGTSLDRTPEGSSGIQIDSLGAGALNYHRLTRQWSAPEVRKTQLTQRGYDLVVLWIGTNVMWVPPNEGYATEFIGDLRDALPNLPVLVLTPGDTVKHGATKSDPRIVEVAKQMKKVAQGTHSAFWDFREAMGGDGAMVNFAKRGLAGEDRIHFGPEGSQVMAQRLLCAMAEGLSAHLAKHPDAGCPR